jgi:hypothetical protein
VASFSDTSFAKAAFDENAWSFGAFVEPEVTAPVKRKGAPGPEAGSFLRRRAEIVVRGKVFQVSTEEEAEKIIEREVVKAKQKAKTLPKTEAAYVPPVIQIEYPFADLQKMADEANKRILDYYAREFARAVQRAQEDDEEIAVLLLH